MSKKHMLPDDLRAEMRFYAETDDYSDAERYERFAVKCKLDKKAFEIGRVVRDLILSVSNRRDVVKILETASATGLTAVGVKSVLEKARIKHVYTSLDREPNLLDFAYARGRGDVFVKGDFNALPFAHAQFDIYIMMGAEGYRTEDVFYAEVRRVLKKGGYFIMPQIGPHPVVSEREKESVVKAGLKLVRVDNYLVAKN